MGSLCTPLPLCGYICTHFSCNGVLCLPGGGEGALHIGKLRHGGAEGLARRDLSTQGMPSGAPQPGCAHIPTSHMHGGTGTCNLEL